MLSLRWSDHIHDCLFFLVTSVAEVPAQSPVSHITSSNDVSYATWDPEEGDVDMEEGMELLTAVNPSDICQKFSSELRKKFEVRKTTEKYRAVVPLCNHSSV